MLRAVKAYAARAALTALSEGDLRVGRAVRLHELEVVAAPSSKPV